MREYHRDLKRFAAIREYRLGGLAFEWVPCAYCGLPSTDREHVIPKSFTQALSDMDEVLPERLYLVPSCRECNSMSGSKVFENVTQKRRYIHQRIRERYQKLLRMPTWTDGDLEELSPDLARYVRHGLQFKDLISSRLTWPRGSFHVASAVVASNPPAHLKSSVSGNAESPSITPKFMQPWNGSKASRSTKTLKCERNGCQKEFKTNQPLRRFCSEACRYEASRVHPHGETPTSRPTYQRQCRICGELFVTYWKSRETCSTACRQRFLRALRDNGPT